MEEFVEDRKKHCKDGGYDYENTDDIPHDINEVIDDVHECSDDFKERGEKCFKYCGKRKIMSMSNMANMLMDPKIMQKLKQFNAREYRSSHNKLGPYSKLKYKLANPKVKIHEKRKTLQKAEVGEGLLDIIETLIIPAIKKNLKEK